VRDVEWFVLNLPAACHQPVTDLLDARLIFCYDQIVKRSRTEEGGGGATQNPRCGR
jgi:hypothetical protein